MGAHIQSGLFAGAALPATRLRSTLEMPPKRWLDHWHLGRIDDDTVRVYLERTYSLGVCCRDCKRLVEITPPELEARFGAKLDLPIREIARRLRCTGNDGCGSDDIAVFPHLYDDPV